MLIVLAATTLPRLVLAPHVGWLVDRHRWKPTLMAASAARVVVMVGLVALFRVDTESDYATGMLATLVMGQSVSGLVIDSARTAAFQHEVPSAHRAALGSLSMFLLTSVAVKATGVAAPVVAEHGLVPALGVCLAASVIGWAVLAVEYPDPPDQPCTRCATVAASLRAATRLIRTVPQLAMVAVASLCYGLCLGMINFALPFYVYETLAAAETGYATLTIVFSVCTLGGLFAVPALCARFEAERVLIGGACRVVASYALLAVAPTLVVAACGMALNGALFAGLSIAQGPLLLDHSPPGQVGSISAALAPLRSLLQLLGSAAVFVWVVTSPGVAAVTYRMPYAVAVGVLFVATVILAHLHRKVAHTI